jgi:signal transduction histidine kinase
MPSCYRFFSKVIRWLLLIGCAAVNPVANAADASANSLFAVTSGAGLYNDPTNGLGDWIWSVQVGDNQICHLWKSFEIPKSAPISRARLVMTADNEFTLFLDGRELGHGAEWRELFIFDLTPLLSPGRHTLAIRAFNSYGFAGVLLGLQVDLADGRSLAIKSDTNWRVVPDGVKDWEKISEPSADWPGAVVKTLFGNSPYWVKPENINIMPTLHPAKTYFWQTGWFQVLLLSVCLLAIITSLWLVTKLALHQKEQWLLRRERARIARDIHDDLGAKITQLVLHGEVAQSELPANTGLRSQLDQICLEARQVLSVLDEILWAVNPNRDVLRDFNDYVCDYAEQFLKFTSIQCFLDVAMEAPPLKLDLPLRRGMLMVLKEALNNVVKHSGATEVRLQIRCERGWLTLSLQDNGKGFVLKTAEQKRSGLRNMSQRLAELGGTCRVTSQPGSGCQVEFSAPLKQSRWQFRGRPLFSAEKKL